jgi:hypothetical protein
MLLNSTFDPAAIEREKGTILQVIFLCQNLWIILSVDSSLLPQEMEVVEKVEEEVVFDNRESSPAPISHVNDSWAIFIKSE